MKPAQISQPIAAPSSWAELPWGEYYREALEQHLQPWWPKMFGFHLLKLGGLSTEIATNQCAISHQVNVSSQGENLHVIADPRQLPFTAKSVDACLLAQTLAYSADPHRILREVDRVLIDDGWLILSGFNPVSLLGAARLLPGLRRRQPYCSRMFSQTRIIDWLSLLNYEVLYCHRFQVFPWSRKKSGWNTHLPLFGCLGLIIARKRTIPLTLNPLKRRLVKPALSRALGATKSYRQPPG
ncbi:class I SAM-dependent methyltransferase [Affinibrenneria salicis]|uniref:Class I SAM-dependent methyltransferase n=1 Tax=Affinibrenneria salicis TaxID=2590031 RepID=A0A5J5FT43_9GAMM|nr:methyltransferase domain-containing protein [Affinibrenneria salicis]KAA8995912.1 class I SAM-dependent methyltransferase [Affinibrenneria salicis]